MIQWVKHLTLDLSSSLDLRVVRLSPISGSALAWSLLKILSLPPPLPTVQPPLENSNNNLRASEKFSFSTCFGWQLGR